MTIVDISYVGLFCIGCRVIETVGRLFINWLRKKFSVGRVQSNYKRLVALVSPELHAKLKAHVLLLDMTITEYILAAVTEKLKREQS